MDKVQFSDPLLFLKLIGLNPFQDDRFSKTRKCFFAGSFFLVVFLGILELLLNFDNPATIIRGSEVMFSYYQLAWKYIVLVRYRKQLADLIEASARFWDLDQLGSVHKTDNYENHRLLRKFYTGYMATTLFSCIQYTLAAIFADEPMVLSLGETQGLSPKALQFYFILHNVFLFTALNLVGGFDGLFFYLIAHILSELKMVKVAFGEDKIQPCWQYKERFRQALTHHIFVLDYIQHVDRVYSMMLLNVQIGHLFALCFGSLLLIIDGVPPDFEHISKFLPYIAVIMIQLWMFCFAGNLVSDWSTEIAPEIFYEDWSLDRAYENKLDKIIILKRAQRPATLTIGGFRNLDLTNFTLVVKNAASFFTFVNTMLNK